jgi:hypothetical protein
MSKEYNVVIKRGAMDVAIPRKDLISSIETPDGLTFKFKYGLNITIDDPGMSSAVKQQICIADITFKEGNLIIDLNNYNSPVSISKF